MGSGFTEVFGGLGALLGFLFSLGLKIQGVKGIDLLTDVDSITTNPQLYTKVLLIFLVIVVVTGGIGALVGAFLDGSNK